MEAGYTALPYRIDFSSFQHYSVFCFSTRSNVRIMPGLLIVRLSCFALCVVVSLSSLIFSFTISSLY